jgi:hypothetical protein
VGLGVAALAAAGWFEEAAEVASQARQLARQAGHYEQAAAINTRRLAYLDRRPCHDPSRRSLWPLSP